MAAHPWIPALAGFGCNSERKDGLKGGKRAHVDFHQLMEKLSELEEETPRRLAHLAPEESLGIRSRGGSDILRFLRAA